MTRIAIIADDLTGALDAASPFACRGGLTLCFTEPDAIDVDAAIDADVISVSTNSRHMPPERAATTVRAAAEKIRALAPDIVLKKIDSRLKGNVAVECDAVASVFDLRRLLVVPAAPDVGRHVRQGAVEGAGVTQPLQVSSLFARSANQINCPDVPSRAVLQDIAQSFLRRRDALPVCSRGFAVALADCLFAGDIAENTSLTTPWLVAIGSRDPVTVEQRLALCDGAEFDCFEAPGGKIEIQLPSSQALLLYCSDRQLQPAETVAIQFADGVRRVSAAIRPGTLLCSGGDTARAVLHAFGQTRLHLLGEAAPGLPMSRITLAGQDVIFISKSGGFGGRSTLLDVFSDQPGRIRPKVPDADGPQHRQSAS